MSAKQAMDNMQKIKSESNRMLREKDVSLPYHRPKAISLKAILSKHRPAVTSDGKSLPIKMTTEQLAHYALLLEQRQKEVIELCKSDTEEEIDESSTQKQHEMNDNTDKHTLEKNEDVSSSVDEVTAKHIDTAASLLNVTGNIGIEEHAPTDIVLSETAIRNKNESKFESYTINNINNVDSEQHKICSEPDSQLTCLQYGLEENYNSVEISVHSSANVQNTELTEPTDNQISTEKICNEPDSQLMCLQYGSKKDYNSEEFSVDSSANLQNNQPIEATENQTSTELLIEHNYNNLSDDDIDLQDVDYIIANADIITDTSSDKAKCDSSKSLLPVIESNVKPKLVGTPGMVIDLNNSDSNPTPRLSGVDLLKEKFVYFSKLCTPEEKERQKERKIKPGIQYTKLKQKLEEQIAEQQSLEWQKRQAEMKQQQIEAGLIRADDDSDDDHIEKIEAELEKKEVLNDDEDSDSTDSENLVDEDIIIKEEKPRKKNDFIFDEVEESNDVEISENDEEDESGHDENEDSDLESESSSEDEQLSKPKKGRILKAFEDSDDEDPESKDVNKKELSPIANIHLVSKEAENSPLKDHKNYLAIKDSQDEELQLAQVNKSHSEDLFTSQENTQTENDKESKNDNDDTNIGTQSFSILNFNATINIDNSLDLKVPDKLSVMTEAQSCDNVNMDPIVGMCPGRFSQNLVPSQNQISQPLLSQDIGEDLLVLCTGKFYNNKFVSQVENKTNLDEKLTDNQSENNEDKEKEGSSLSTMKLQNLKEPKDDEILMSILPELDDNGLVKGNMVLEMDSHMKKKQFSSDQIKKKFVINSDDDEATNDDCDTTRDKTKKTRNRKFKQRALQISDDEEDEMSEDSDDELTLDNDAERIVEYDSEENEIEIVNHGKMKKNRKIADFLEQEAELSSEDDWVGSGDEDEADLDRMEREEGDNDIFQQDKLQRELGEIHMRDVMDQDKREVRLLQELLLEDGELGAGHRQRRFRWKNIDGNEAMGTIPEDLTGTQEEEFESEEQWRKERHERETFLRQMQQKDDSEDSLDITVNKTTIKPSVNCKSSNNIVERDADVVTTDQVVQSTNKDIPSPKRNYTIYQQNYHGSLLSRGRGALARLAALATPLVADDDDAPKASLAPSSARNFVFATITPEDKQPKAVKRKAINTGTPKLLKTMKTDERKLPKSSLLDHMTD